MAYTNGKIPNSALKSISTPGKLLTPAAESFERLRAAAKKDGFNMGTSGTAQAYRPLAEQVALLEQNYDHTYRPGGYGDTVSYGGKTWYKKPGHASTAKPGTSNHGNGLAVDFQGLGGFNGRGYAWMKAHAGDYGWTNTEGKSVGEAWHWVYNAANDKHKTAAAPATKRKPHRIGTIKRGDQTWRTRLWQNFLKEQGYKITVDGSFGPATQSATKAWQKKAGLAVDGVVGPKTWFRAAYGVKPGVKKSYRVQIAQRIFGLTGSGVDGSFGPTTTARAKEVQRWLGVSADAAFGPTTINALLKKG